MTQLFTKSRFKLALECPTKLFYASLPERYNNQNEDDEFLRSLAEGGFQVGALAKLYRGVEYDLSDCKGYDEPLKETERLLKENTNVIIAEAAFKWNNCFVRVDILEKRGNTLHIIEVKAKSSEGENERFVNIKTGGVLSDWLPYVYDVAFQKYVVQQAMPEYNVTASLMMADKTKRADVDHLNQLFAIRRDENNQTVVDVAENAAEVLSESKTQVLIAIDMTELCDKIIAGETPEQSKCMGMCFKDFVQMTSQAFAQKAKLPTFLSGKCSKCEFRKGDSSLKDGHDECLCEIGGFAPADFARPQIEQLWGAGGAGTKRGVWMQERRYFMDEITEADYSFNQKTKTKSDGLDGHQRTWLQIAIATNDADLRARFGEDLQGNTYLDIDGLRKEMETWKFPLHMIDFETTAVALPMYKGMRPYEQVAFQFSHHIIEKTTDGGYTIRHAGQYLNEDVQKFPNFEFVRHLREELTKDDGTIFRYATHENRILRAIYRQLEASDEADKDELMAFIDSITYLKDDKVYVHIGERNMVDLQEVVKRYYYQYDEMLNSNSIKQVLPAVLNTSKFLQEKYQEAIYGTEIPSLNISHESPMAWIAYTEDGKVDNPYHLLQSVGELIGENIDDSDSQEDEDMTVANGGAALTAYSKLMFCKDDIWDDALREALLRYCELDTMAMVFIWEYFHRAIVESLAAKD